jgi:glycosyltransferase involved in cell wall biosynthesis
MTSEWKFLLSNDDRIELRVGTFEPFPFSEGDVYLYPSRLDGIGLTLPEAMSCGLAAITTNAGPMNEFITDQVTGLLVSVDKYLGRNDGYYWAENICSLESLRASMQWYLDNKELIQEHKKNAREYATAFLDWMKNGMLLLEFLKLQKSKELTSTDIRLARAIDQTYSQSLWQRVRSLNACLHSTIKALRIQ